MSWLRDLQLLAMQSVVRETGDYNLRYIFRWYSRTFHTPLHVVEDLPLEDVLRHYYEVQFEDLDEAERNTQIERLVTSPDKLARLRLQEDAEDADMFEFGKEAAAAAIPPSPVTKGTSPIEEKMARVEQQLAGKTAPVLEEGIHMEFEDVDVPLDDAPGFGPPEKPKG